MSESTHGGSVIGLDELAESLASEESSPIYRDPVSRAKLKRAPIIENKLSVSKDNRYFIITRIEKFIYPINYVNKVMGIASQGGEK